MLEAFFLWSEDASPSEPKRGAVSVEERLGLPIKQGENWLRVRGKFYLKIFMEKHCCIQ